MSPIADPKDFKPIEIISKDPERNVCESGVGPFVTFILSREPEFEWIHIFEENCKGRFVDAAFRILKNRLEIHLGNPALLQQAYDSVKNTVLPRTNSSYHVKIEEEWKKLKRQAEESEKKRKKAREEFDKLEL